MNNKSRPLDILAACLLWFLSSPFMAIIAIAIFLSCGSPILYLERRVGLKGKGFKLYKFRTLESNGTNILQDHDLESRIIKNETPDRCIGRLDLYYVANRSLWLDLKIIAKTFSVVLSARGAF